MGTIETETISNISPAFQTRREAEDCYQMATIYEHFREIRKVKPAASLLSWWNEKLITRESLSPNAYPYYDGLIDRLGKLLEREKLNEEAIGLSSTTPASPARERLAKLLIKAGDKDLARQICLAIHNEPNDAEEYYAATQILAKLDNTAKRSQARPILAASLIIELDYLYTGVELETFKYFEQQGWKGGHTENWLWNGVFGLSFWDIIYDDSQGFHQPLQRAPSDLYKGFYFNRREQIEERLKQMANRTFAKKQITRMIHEKQGLSNPFVGWHESLPGNMDDLIEVVPLNSIVAIMREMAKDLKNNTRGFPDLFLHKEAGHKFIEVKSENDQLSAQQYFWQQRFKEHGIAVEILKVYRFRSKQNVFLVGLVKAW